MDEFKPAVFCFLSGCALGFFVGWGFGGASINPTVDTDVRPSVIIGDVGKDLRVIQETLTRIETKTNSISSGVSLINFQRVKSAGEVKEAAGLEP